eukprot:CAMPEP_0204384548 /NCGR_PEP_ID=MMETSP0469-20131031/56965_1 /ASSEMBLY_ACC=CAM_ASM_000384 /TAXON_ID=2969 /ORGANISM="Oxyrrhis marina" /LENGTH=71 /DNA_ID=CAMNT_0051377205 /DNA_START=1 /DNA_END=212 /DNA_ORIENTATION=+
MKKQQQPARTANTGLDRPGNMCNPMHEMEPPMTATKAVPVTGTPASPVPDDDAKTGRIRQEQSCSALLSRP